MYVCVYVLSMFVCSVCAFVYCVFVCSVCMCLHVCFVCESMAGGWAMTIDFLFQSIYVYGKTSAGRDFCCFHSF